MRVTLMIAAGLLAAACTTEPEVLSSSQTTGDDQVAADASEVSGAAAAAAAVDQGVAAALLLTEADLPGWRFTGAMDVPHAPGPTDADCPALVALDAAHQQAGQQIKAIGDRIMIRQTVVAMPTADEAAQVIDAADRVWQECAEVTPFVDPFRTEPFGVADGGWHAAGLAYIAPGEETTITAYWQQGPTVLILQMAGVQVRSFAAPLTEATAARLQGTSRPVSPTIAAEEP